MGFPLDSTYKIQVVPIEIEYKGRFYQGMGVPLSSSCHAGVCFELDITLNNEHLGVIHCRRDGWKMAHVDQGLVDAIGEEIFLWYE